MAILRFIFTDLWHFFGTLILVSVTGEVIADIVRAAVPDYRPNFICCNCKEENLEKDNAEGTDER